VTGFCSLALLNFPILPPLALFVLNFGTSDPFVEFDAVPLAIDSNSDSIFFSSYSGSTAFLESFFSAFLSSSSSSSSPPFSKSSFSAFFLFLASIFSYFFFSSSFALISALLGAGGGFKVS
jgi:hypothetical protein